MVHIGYCSKINCQKLSSVTRQERLNFSQITTLFSLCQSCNQVANALHVKNTFSHVENEFARQFVLEFEKMSLFKSHLVDFQNSVRIENDLTCNEIREFDEQVKRGVLSGKITILSRDLL